VNHVRNRELAEYLRAISHHAFECGSLTADQVEIIDEAAKRLEFWTDPALEHLKAHGVKVIAKACHSPEEGILHLFLTRGQYLDWQDSHASDREDTQRGGMTLWELRGLVLHCASAETLFSLEST
jgi:hypothetical protein